MYTLKKDYVNYTSTVEHEIDLLNNGEEKQRVKKETEAIIKETPPLASRAAKWIISEVGTLIQCGKFVETRTKMNPVN